MSDIGHAQRVHVWDVAVRLTHWLVAALVIGQWITGEILEGGAEWHTWSGCVILALVLFRIAWGLFGSRYARFSSFVRGPGVVLGYARHALSAEAPHYVGHNPLGGWSALAMWCVLLVQAGTGLFANDDVLMEGPLFDLVSKDTSDYITWIHHISFSVLTALVALHLLAIIFYWRVRKQNLVSAMLTGYKRRQDHAAWAGEYPPLHTPLWRAAVLLALAVGGVWLLVGT